MGVAYLRLRRKWTGPADEGKALFSSRDSIPFAWCLLFRRGDLRFPDDALVAASTAALALARQRVDLLRRDADPQLVRLLDRFLELLAREEGPDDFLIEDWEVEASPLPLVEWFDTLDGEPVTPSLLAKGAEVSPVGLDWGDDGELRMGLDSAELTTGSAANPADRAKLLDLVVPEARPLRRARRAELEELANVYLQPFDLAPRLVCADRLSALGDPWGEFILLQCNAQTLTLRQGRRLRRLWHELEAELSAPFAPAQVAFENGFAAHASFATPPTTPIANPRIWKTVHTVDLQGGAEALSDPAFQNVRRITLTGDDVSRIVDLRRPLPVLSIRLSANGANTVWKSLSLKEYFPSLVEVHLASMSVWLPDGLKLLLEARPELNARSGALVHVTQLAPLTIEQQEVRRAKWDQPFGAGRLVGARFDDQYG